MGSDNVRSPDGSVETLHLGVPTSLSERLQAKTAVVIARTESHPADPLGPAGTAARLRNILLQCAHFGDHLAEAVFTAFDRFPSGRP